jgi:NAD(P)-dependent dehydrogenase (short-subunit alcohol dehydrogenase family)
MVAGVVFRHTDLGDPTDIEAAAATVGDRVDVLFNCQGISGGGAAANGLDVLRVNFLGVRQLSEALLPRIPYGGAIVSIASAGGLGWKRRIEQIDELLATEDFAAGMSWARGHADGLLATALPDAYAFSKQALIVWTMRHAVGTIAHGVRVNCTSPGSTATAMAAEFPDEGVAFMNRPSGRASTVDEQAWPLVFLGSPVASYVNGVNLVVDGGNAAARTFGLLEAAAA